MLITAVTVLSAGMATMDVMRVVVSLIVMITIVSNLGGVHLPRIMLATSRVIIIAKQFKKDSDKGVKVSWSYREFVPFRPWMTY